MRDRIPARAIRAHVRVTGGLWTAAGLGIVSVATFTTIALLPRVDIESTVINHATAVRSG